MRALLTGILLLATNLAVAVDRFDLSCTIYESRLISPDTEEIRDGFGWFKALEINKEGNFTLTYSGRTTPEMRNRMGETQFISDSSIVLIAKPMSDLVDSETLMLNIFPSDVPSLYEGTLLQFILTSFEWAKVTCSAK